MTRRAALATLAALALTAAPALAHPGHEHKIRGTVTMAAADHVMLKDTAGKDVTVYLTAETKVRRGKTAATAADIQNGMRVAVTAVTEKVKDVERMRATVIELGAVPSAR